MRYLFLTACRNEELILRTFFDEFSVMLERAGIAGSSELFVVDDLSTDRTREILAEQKRARSGFDLHIISAPTNLGNQGAMFYGLQSLAAEPDDVVLTFDCDGEDDVKEIPSILELGRAHPDKLVFIERGRRHESPVFKAFFSAYKLLFGFLTHQTVVPNNFMLLRGKFIPTIQRSPLAAVHFAYAILRLRLPHVVTSRDRRQRYGGQTSQNIFMLVSHGLVGLMVFYEIVISKIFMLLFASGAAAALALGLALVLPTTAVLARGAVWTAILASSGAAGLFGLLLAAALAFIFKLVVFSLNIAGPPAAATPRLEADGLGRGVARAETDDSTPH